MRLQPGAVDFSALESWDDAMLITFSPTPSDTTPDLSRIIAATTTPARLPGLASWIAQTAIRMNSQVYLLVTIEQTSDGDEANLLMDYQSAQKILADVASSLRVLGVHAHWEVRFGDIGEEVATLATTTGTSVIVLERPVRTRDSSDVARVVAYVREHGPQLSLLVGPARRQLPPAPSNGYGRA